jgi:hypothetical protein
MWAAPIFRTKEQHCLAPLRREQEEDEMPNISQGTENLRAAEQFAGLAAWANPMLAWGEASEAYLKAYAAWQKEMSRFIGARVDADVAARKSLAECNTLADAAKLQQDWAAATVNDYMNESGRLMEIAARCIPPAPAVSGPGPRAGKDESLRSRAAS